MMAPIAPDKHELRKFGLIFATGLILIFGLFLPWVFEKPWPTWPWIAAAGFVVTALLLPQALKPVFLLWLKVGHAVGWFNTRLILAILFFIMFAPVSLFFYLIGRDSMQRRLDASIKTYRTKSEQLPRERMEKPF